MTTLPKRSLLQVTALPKRSPLLLLAPLLAASLTLLSSAPARAAGTERFAVVIGNNRGSAARKPLRYAQSDARKMAAVLRTLGRFAPRNTTVHIGGSAEAVWRTLRRLEQTLAQRKRQGAGRSLLLIYYSGHASRAALELGKSTVTYKALLAYLKRSKADVRVAVIDACQSGQLVSTKGGTPGPGYRISLSDHMASQGYAIITSSTGSELSQESAALRGSTFTHHFVSALRGAGDDSGDDKVTLAEAYRYAYTRTVAHTAANLGGGQHPMYKLKLSGRGDIVLTSPKAFSSGLRFRPSRAGRLLVLSADRERVVAEASTRGGAALRVALKPGGYWVYMLAGRDVRRARLVVRAGRFSELASSALAAYTPRASVSKGGLFAPRPVHRVEGGFLVRRMPLDGSALTYGGAVSYAIELPSGLAPSLTLTTGAAPDAGLSEGYFEVGAHAGLSFTWLRFFRRRLAATVEVRAGYELLAQSSRDDQRRYTSSFAYYGGLGLRVPIAGRFAAFIGGGAGGRLFELRSQGWVHRLDLQATLRMVWQWPWR